MKELDYPAVIKGAALAVLIAIGMAIVTGLFGGFLRILGVGPTIPLIAGIVVAVLAIAVPAPAGGYVAAKSAGHAPDAHGLATGLALFAAYLVADLALCEFAWIDIAYGMVYIPLAWAGSRLCAILEGTE